MKKSRLEKGGFPLEGINLILCEKCMEKIKKGGRYIQYIDEILKKVYYFKELRNIMRILS